MQKLQYELTLTKHRRNKYFKQNDKKGGETREFKQKRLKQKKIKVDQKFKCSLQGRREDDCFLLGPCTIDRCQCELFKNRNIIS